MKTSVPLRVVFWSIHVAGGVLLALLFPLIAHVVYKSAWLPNHKMAFSWFLGILSLFYSIYSTFILFQSRNNTTHSILPSLITASCVVFGCARSNTRYYGPAIALLTNRSSFKKLFSRHYVLCVGCRQNFFFAPGGGDSEEMVCTLGRPAVYD